MAEIVKYLDPAATGTGDGNSWTNAYASLAALEAANAQLSGSGNWWHVYFRSLGGTADTTQVNWDGWTTSDTEYVLFEGIAGQRAVVDGWKTDRYRWSVTNPANTMALILSDNYIYFDGMQMEMLSNHNGDSLIYHANNPGLRLTNCRVRVGATGGAGITVWVYQSQGASCEAKVWNTIMEKHPSHNASDVARGWYGQLGHGDLYNCVVYGFNRGVLSNDANTDTYDSAVFNNDDDFYHITNPGTIDYCASDDNDGTNNVAEGTTGGAAWPNIFEDAANGDFRLKAEVALIGAGGMAGSGLFSTDIEGTTRGAAWDVGAHEYVGVDPNITLPITGVSGAASVGAVALSAALALAGLAGTGGVGTLGPDVTMPISGVEAPASPGTMSPMQAAVLAGIEAVNSAGGVTPTTALTGVSSGMTYPLSGVEATGEVGTMTPEIGVSPDITIPITGVSSGIAYQLSGEEATGGVGTVTAVATYDDITLPVTGVVGTGAVGSITYFEGPGGEAMTGEVGDVAPTVAPPLTGNEATAAVDSVGQDRTAGLGGVAGTGAAGGWNTIARAITGTGGTGAAGTLTPTRSKAITGNAAVGRIMASTASRLATQRSVAPVGVTGTGRAGYLDTFVPGTITRPLTGVYATGRAGTVTCLTASPNYIKVKPRKRILTVQPRRRIITVSRRRF